MLFEIKEMKKGEVEVVLPPHLVESKSECMLGKEKKEKKKISSQQIL